MNKELSTKDMIKVMSAYVKGKTIQVYNDTTGCWDLCNEPRWNWRDCKYRVYKETKISNIRSCYAFDIIDNFGYPIVKVKTFDDSGTYWKEMVNRLIKLDFVDIPICLDLTVRNGKNNSLFEFQVKSDGNTTPLKHIRHIKKI